MRLIPLYKGRTIAAYARVDDQDHARLASSRWHLHSDGYACRAAGRSVVLMHREVLGLVSGSGFEVDHVNGDRLDNQRANVRAVTRAQNAQNYPSFGRSSRFRNVSWIRRRERWQVKVKVDGRSVFVGYFDDEIEAANAAETFRREHLPFAQPDPALTKALGEREGATA